MAKRILVILMALFVVFAVGSCKEATPPAPEEPTDVAVTGVSLNETSITLNLGGTATLEPTVTPADATNKAVTWSSSAPTVATVVDGVVTAVTSGMATITVTTVDGDHSAICSVVVTNPLFSDFDGTLTISPNSNVVVGTELIATYTGTVTSFSYQWQKDGEDITGETSSKYTPTTAGDYLVVISKANYNPLPSDAVTVTLPILANPLEEFVIKAYSGMTYDAGAEATPVNVAISDLPKFNDSKYIVIVSQGVTINSAGFGGAQIYYQGGGLSWTQSNLFNGWINFSHSATDIVCFVIQLDKLNGYTDFLNIETWVQFGFKFYNESDPADLKVKAVLLLGAGADTVFSSLTDKVLFKVHETSAGGFASKTIDVTGLY